MGIKGLLKCLQIEKNNKNMKSNFYYNLISFFFKLRIRWRTQLCDPGPYVDMF